MSFDFYELLSRAESGPRLPKREWDFKRVVIPVRELVDKYQLRWDPTILIPTDRDLTERVFQAGLDLAVQTGMFCLDTGRVIQFTHSELEADLSNMRTQLPMGEGWEARTLVARQVLDPQPPLVWAGNPGAPTPEDLFLPMVKSWAQEPIVDLVTCG